MPCGCALWAPANTVGKRGRCERDMRPTHTVRTAQKYHEQRITPRMSNTHTQNTEHATVRAVLAHVQVSVGFHEREREHGRGGSGSTSSGSAGLVWGVVRRQRLAASKG